MINSQDIDQAISADEIGIRTARLGPCILQSAFQFLYRPCDDTLRLAAAEGLLRPFISGAPLPPAPYLAALDDADRAMAEEIGTALHISNFHQLELYDIDHLVSIRAGGAASRPGELVRLLVEAGTEASHVIGIVRDPATFSSGFLIAMIDDLRRLGARVAIGSAGQPPLDVIRRTVPDFVSIDGGWFRRVCGNVSAMRLLCSLVSGLRRQGMQVLVEGVETRAQLAAAIETGADLIQGYLLSHPQLVGSAWPEPVIRLPDLLAGGAEIVPLFDGRARRIHQPG